MFFILRHTRRYVVISSGQQATVEPARPTEPLLPPGRRLSCNPFRAMHTLLRGRAWPVGFAGVGSQEQKPPHPDGTVQYSYSRRYSSVASLSRLPLAEPLARAVTSGAASFRYRTVGLDTPYSTSKPKDHEQAKILQDISLLKHFKSTGEILI